MKSNFVEDVAMNLNASPLTSRRLSASRIFATFAMKEYCVDAFSTAVTLAAPRLSS